MINQTAPDTTDDVSEALGEAEIQAYKQKSISGAISFTIRSLFLYGMGLATTLILSAYLTVEAFGIYGLVTQLVALLAYFSDIGLGPALIQKKAEPTLTEYRAAFTIQQLLSWLVVGLTFALIRFVPMISEKLGDQGLVALMVLVFSIPLGSLKTVPANILERKLDFSKLIIPNIAEQLVYNAILIYLAMSGYGVISYAYAIGARALVGVVVMYLVQSWSFGLSLNSKAARSILGMGLKFQMSTMLAPIKDNLFYLTLGWILPVKEFGYIMWSKNWSQVPYMLTVQNVISITFPAYSRIQHRQDLLKKAIEKTLFFITLAIFPLLVGMSIFIIPLTQVIERYHKWQLAVPTFIMFTLSIGWAAISTPLTNTLNALGKVGTTLKLMIMWTILTWGLTPVGIYFFGFNGVAAAALVISFSSYASIYYVRKHVEIEVWGNVWRQLLASSVMAGAGVLGLSIWSQSLLHLLLGGVTVSLVYLASLLIIGQQKLRLEVNSILVSRHQFF